MSKVSGLRRRHKFDRLIERDGLLCHWCKHPFDFDHPMTLDHLIPLVYGGGSEDHNLVLACARCNTDRHHRALCEACGHRVRCDGVARNLTTWHKRCLLPDLRGSEA